LRDNDVVADVLSLGVDNDYRTFTVVLIDLSDQIRDVLTGVGFACQPEVIFGILRELLEEVEETFSEYRTIESLNCIELARLYKYTTPTSNSKNSKLESWYHEYGFEVSISSSL
jgi:hypothetical protein